MTITIKTAGNNKAQAALEAEKNGCYVVRVYEQWGSEWHTVRESGYYVEQAKAKATYNRYIRKYVSAT